MEDRNWTPAGQAERYDPLPSFLLLPVRGWRMLSPRGRRVVAALAVALAIAIAVAWPHVQRDRRAGEAERAAIAAQSRTNQLRALTEDQRPRHAVLPASMRVQLRTTGGLESQSAATLVGAQLEAAISHDVRARVAAEKLDGPVRQTTCDPVRSRSPLGADYNCFVLIDSTVSGGRVMESGYRFSARAQLPAGTLAWCKENPRPLHPTAYVLTVPISPDCR